jgi:hypothetical protein
MTTELDLDVGQATFGVRGSQCTDAVNQEAIVCDWRLESLLSSPSHANCGCSMIHFWLSRQEFSLLDDDSRPINQGE